MMLSTAFAANHWSNEDGTWKYLDKDNSEYISLIKNYYLDIYEKNQWGYSFNSLIGGLNNIHPSKVKAIV